MRDPHQPRVILDHVGAGATAASTMSAGTNATGRLWSAAIVATMPFPTSSLSRECRWVRRIGTYERAVTASHGVALHGGRGAQVGCRSRASAVAVTCWAVSRSPTSPATNRMTSLRSNTARVLVTPSGPSRVRYRGAVSLAVNGSGAYRSGRRTTVSRCFGGEVGCGGSDVHRSWVASRSTRGVPGLGFGRRRLGGRRGRRVRWRGYDLRGTWRGHRDGVVGELDDFGWTGVASRTGRLVRSRALTYGVSERARQPLPCHTPMTAFLPHRR